MTQPINVLKVDFVRAMKRNNNNCAAVCKDLMISVGSFYKYKKKWLDDGEQPAVEIIASPADAAKFITEDAPEAPEVFEPTDDEIKEALTIVVERLDKGAELLDTEALIAAIEAEPVIIPQKPAIEPDTECPVAYIDPDVQEMTVTMAIGVKQGLDTDIDNITIILAHDAISDLMTFRVREALKLIRADFMEQFDHINDVLDNTKVRI